MAFAPVVHIELVEAFAIQKSSVNILFLPTGLHASQGWSVCGWLRSGSRRLALAGAYPQVQMHRFTHGSAIAAW